MKVNTAPASIENVELSIVSHDHQIPSGTEGIRLFLRNKKPFGRTVFSPERTVLYVHGATLPSEVVFDLPIDGTSWADDLARHGWDVWMVNIRGYGRSTWPRAMREPAGDNGPVATTEEAVADFSSAVDFILGHRRLPRIQVIGWSWGTVIAGRFAAAHPDRVQSLVLVTPLWANDNTIPVPSQPTGAWQEWTLAESRARSQTGVPAGEADRILPATTLKLFQRAVRESQPEAAGRVPERFRSPTGVMADGAWRGDMPYDASLITAPTLIIRGKWDELTPRSMSIGLFTRLTGAELRGLVEVPRASHFIPAETGRLRLFEETRAFLARR
ncbi:MAG TPA: alpha/beta hydrolase [Rhodospirillaceae bacterium]|nr:alpha/beta hydrolase [Rhodospirillaceae bacterium]